MKDIYGIELKVGQKVAAAVGLGGRQPRLVKAKITDFTLRQAYIETDGGWLRRIAPNKLAVVAHQ